MILIVFNVNQCLKARKKIIKRNGSGEHSRLKWSNAKKINDVKVVDFFWNEHQPLLFDSVGNGAYR